MYQNCYHNTESRTFQIYDIICLSANWKENIAFDGFSSSTSS